MQRKSLNASHALPFVIAGILAGGPVFADRHAWGGHQNAGKHEWRENQSHGWDHDGRPVHQRDEHERDERDFSEHRYFDDRHRAVIHDYYIEEYHAGHCPPGLAKKHNGCMPPGLARQWQIGRPLPRSVIYYDLPPAIVIQLGPPLVGYRYARVGSDVLLIAIGTGLVVDAIMDLSGY